MLFTVLALVVDDQPNITDHGPRMGHIAETASRRPVVGTRVLLAWASHVGGGWIA